MEIVENKALRKHGKPKRYFSAADVLANTVRVGRCMHWRGAKNKDGYPVCGVGGVFQSCALHRELFRLLHGYVPEVVMHKCDNRACINPKHLLAGTHEANLADKLSKNRQARGEQNGNAKMSLRGVAVVRDMHRNGLYYREIAALFGLSRATVWRILSKKNWG